jgi:hypothetical protein
VERNVEETVVTHIEYFIALNDPDDFPEISDGPYGTYQAAQNRIEELSNPEDYVILQGDFPGAYND